eukprot:4419380-Pyramimonas_sp.AAC.1
MQTWSGRKTTCKSIPPGGIRHGHHLLEGWVLGYLRRRRRDRVGRRSFLPRGRRPRVASPSSARCRRRRRCGRR